MKGAPSRPRLQASGDSLLLVELEPRIDPEVNARAVALAEALRAAAAAWRARRRAVVRVGRRARRSAAPRRRRARARRRPRRGTSDRSRAAEPAGWSRFPSATAASTVPTSTRSRPSPTAARRRRAAAQRRGLPRLHAGVPARLRLSRRRGRGDRHAAPGDAAAGGAGRQRRHRRPADRRVSVRAARAAGVSSAARRGGCSTPGGRGPSLLDAGDRVRFVPVAAGQWALFDDGPPA